VEFTTHRNKSILSNRLYDTLRHPLTTPAASATSSSVTSSTLTSSKSVSSMSVVNSHTTDLTSTPTITSTTATAVLSSQLQQLPHAATAYSTVTSSALSPNKFHWTHYFRHFHSEDTCYSSRDNYSPVTTYIYQPCNCGHNNFVSSTRSNSTAASRWLAFWGICLRGSSTTNPYINSHG